MKEQSTVQVMVLSYVRFNCDCSVLIRNSCVAFQGHVACHFYSLEGLISKLIWHLLHKDFSITQDFVHMVCSTFITKDISPQDSFNPLSGLLL